MSIPLPVQSAFMSGWGSSSPFAKVWRGSVVARCQSGRAKSLGLCEKRIEAGLALSLHSPRQPRICSQTQAVSTVAAVANRTEDATTRRARPYMSAKT